MIYTSRIRQYTRRLVALFAVGAVALGACGGADDDSTDQADVSEDANDVAEEPGSPDDDNGSTGDGSTTEASFGQFISGEISVTGDEELTYDVDDPAFDFIGGGGCGAGTSCPSHGDQLRGRPRRITVRRGRRGRRGCRPGVGDGLPLNDSRSPGGSSRPDC